MTATRARLRRARSPTRRVETDECSAPCSADRHGPRERRTSRAVWDALNGSSQRAERDAGAAGDRCRAMSAPSDADPVVTARVFRRRRRRPAFCLAFESEEHARVYTWKTCSHVKPGGRADPQNFEFGAVRLPNNLFHFLRYATDGKVEAVDGRLRLKAEYEAFGRYEPRQGREQRPRASSSRFRAPVATCKIIRRSPTRARDARPGLRRASTASRASGAGAAPPAHRAPAPPARARASPPP